LGESRLIDPAARGVPTVTLTERIDVRRSTIIDFDALLEMKSDPEGIRWSGFAEAPDPKRFRV
jgi:hypothetical protein